ncbi:hypothetical protein QUF76_14030 [Desulfobacterales bacterium HSG16]|nr:hypothetical protein [Desulfobacterales bacterium HSG16]
MINFKQEELIERLMSQIREKFPEVDLINITEHPEDPESLWINVTGPEDEDRDMELIEFAGDKVTDILMDYGYHMLVMPIQAERA